MSALAWHSRLSLVDLAGGAQPIHNGEGSVWITFKGEIFNYVKLRQTIGGYSIIELTARPKHIIRDCASGARSRTVDPIRHQGGMMLQETQTSHSSYRGRQGSALGRDFSANLKSPSLFLIITRHVMVSIAGGSLECLVGKER